jgi:3-deoxy-D-arabino-heptulosonate 7-phosphate (DAHP) synthase
MQNYPLLTALGEVDPSHAVGVARWIAPLAKAALAAGADGIMVKVHPCPQDALCDGAQALTPEQFSELMHGLRALESVSTRSTSAGEAHETPRADMLWKPVGW